MDLPTVMNATQVTSAVIFVTLVGILMAARHETSGTVARALIAGVAFAMLALGLIALGRLRTRAG